MKRSRVQEVAFYGGEGLEKVYFCVDKTNALDQELKLRDTMPVFRYKETYYVLVVHLLTCVLPCECEKGKYNNRFRNKTFKPFLKQLPKTFSSFQKVNEDLPEYKEKFSRKFPLKARKAMTLAGIRKVFNSGVAEEIRMNRAVECRKKGCFKELAPLKRSENKSGAGAYALVKSKTPKLVHQHLQQQRQALSNSTESVRNNSNSLLQYPLSFDPVNVSPYQSISPSFGDHQLLQFCPSLAMGGNQQTNKRKSPGSSSAYQTAAISARKIQREVSENALPIVYPTQMSMSPKYGDWLSGIGLDLSKLSPVHSPTYGNVSPSNLFDLKDSRF